MHSEDEEMMLSENELAVDSEIEPAPVTLEDLQREEQQLVMREDTKKNQLRALIYWVEKGGVLPSWNFDLVDAQDLNSMSAKEFEDYLTGIEVAYQPEPNPFSIDGWEEDAATYQAMTVFSKVSNNTQ